MRIRIRDELLALNILSFLLIIVVIFLPSNVLRIIVGLAFVVLFPGYALTVALFPRKGAISNAGRVALSFGMSVTVIPLIGLILNYTPWGIRLESVLYSVASFIFVTSAIAWLRRRGLAASQRPSIELQLKVPGWSGGAWNKALSVILGLAILAGLGALGYVIATPRVEESLTEFYILGSSGKAIDYPVELVVGEKASVIVGIISHEHKTVSYRVEVRIDGINNKEVAAITLEHGEKWENGVSFTPTKTGQNQKVEFLLYEKGEVEPLAKPLHLWVDVIGQDGKTRH